MADDLKELAKQEMFRRLAAAEKQRRLAQSHPSFEESQKLIDQQDMQGANGAVGSALTSVADGVPVVGPMMVDGAQRGAAALSSLIDGESYDTNLKQAQGITEEANKAHPVIHKAGEVTGAVGGTIPLVAAAPAAFGAGGGSLLARSLFSAVSGGALGGTDAAVRSGGNGDDTRRGAMAGLILGAAGPSVADLVGKGVKSLIEAGRNRLAARAAGIDPEALKFVRRAVTDDALDPAMVQQRLTDMGPDAMLADLGPNLQKQAGALAATPGRGQEIVRKALLDRSKGANARINATVDDNFGRAPLVSALDAEAVHNQGALSPAYREAFTRAGPVDVTPIADDLTRQIQTLRGDPQRALQRVRTMLNRFGAEELDNNPQTMFQTRQAIDGMLSTEADPKVIAALTDARQMIDDGLTRAVPNIKEADASFAELARQREALNRGQQVLESGKTAPRPAELANEVAQGANPQGMQIGPSAVPLRLSQGARAEIDRILGTKANDVVALNNLIKGQGDWNRDRLATLFGQDKADRVIKVLENERAFADTANTVTRNSETAARQAAQSELGGAGVGFGAEEAFKAGGVRGAARAVALDKAKKVAAALLPQSGDRARESLASTLVNQNRDAVIRALMAAGGPAQVPALVNPVVKALLLGSPAGAR
ncbi:hypothetical protein [Rhizobium sp. BK661]|uniref:hypothetical protein n=1 Tax=Rhizobium sp. BK661 TaxID=2586991 RepID=UPI002168B106|nr:hypothetical protein [Rhizobium sp. BK661]MCS3741995.1 hypothetical protein [Rhizobium sp. BK661]